jgi:hypothetical protein
MMIIISLIVVVESIVITPTKTPTLYYFELVTKTLQNFFAAAVVVHQTIGDP